jgi:hypothetical protein
VYFEIQTSNPSIRDCSNEERESLSSALIAIFPAVTEDAIMIWNWVPVRINYNCDLSVIIEDILLMLRDVLSSDHGSKVTSFGANTLTAKWSLNWTDESIRVDAKWEAVAGSYEDLLNSRHVLEFKKDRFLCEWKAILKKVIVAVETSGIKITDEEEVALLNRVEAAIPRFGHLYEVTNEMR